MKHLILFFQILAVAICFYGNQASAEKFESSTLFKKGAWSVELTHNVEEGNLWCTASTINRFSQSLVLTAYDSGQLVLFLFDSSWRLKPRPVGFLIDVDYSRWELRGQADGTSVSVRMNNVKKAAKFLTELQKGSAVAIYNDSVQRLATFSLSGSSAAITSLFECWQSISLEKDPFGKSQDPFGASSDPF